MDIADPGRRKLLQLTAACISTGVTLAVEGAAREPAKLPPQAGDLLCFGSHENAGRDVTAADISLNAAPLTVYPKDPASGVIREKSRLNQILLVQLDPASLNAMTARRATGGFIAYSAICTHAACAVSEWQADKACAVCPCHGSEYDLRAQAKVVAGPAPRGLPMLPIKQQDGKFVVAGKFTGRVGFKAT